MLETVQATATLDDTYGDPFDLVSQVARDPNLWRKISGGAARLHEDASPLGSLVVRRGRFGSAKDRIQVVAEGNLTALVYGKTGKALTLPGSDLVGSLERVVSEAAKHLPHLAPRTMAAYQVSRVDASATWALQPLDAPLVVDFMRNAFWTMNGRGRGRAETSQPGGASFAHQRTNEERLRFYGKTAEAVARGEALPPRLSEAEATLLRLEWQVAGRSCRRHFGETLLDLSASGVDVAKRSLTNWIQTLGDTAMGAGVQDVCTQLVLGGMPVDRAWRMAGPAMVLRSGGVERLVQSGVSPRTARAWAAEIRRCVPDDAWQEALGVPMHVEDAAYADTYCERIA